MSFQELWQRGLQLEDRLDDDIADQWRSWKSKLSQLNCITVPRYFMGNIELSSSIMIHGFGDLSTNKIFQALIRMINGRWLCSTIWSDNAKTFKSADREIQQLFTQESSADRRLWDKKDQEELQGNLMEVHRRTFSLA